MQKTEQKPLNLFEKRLFQAAKENNADLFIEIINKGIDPFIRDESGIPAISYMKPSQLSEEDYNKMMREVFQK